MSDQSLPELRLIPVDPQPTWDESSKGWSWSRRPGFVDTANRAWWEDVPPEDRPNPDAWAVQFCLLGEYPWYWVLSVEPNKN